MKFLIKLYNLQTIVEMGKKLIFKENFNIETKNEYN